VQPPAPIQSRLLAPGIWLLPGPYNSMAVEFKNYAVVLEAPLDEDRGFALINETRRLIPGKPIRYVVNTHHHFDHSGGLRAFGAEDSIVITHESNFNYYEGVVFDLRPRTLEPDPLSLAPRQVHYVLVNESYTLTDGDQTMTVYHMDALEHAADMLVAWFPKAKILFQADMFDPPPAGQPAPPPSANALNLLYNLQRLRLEPETIVSVHGGVYPAGEFTKAMGIERIVPRGGGLNAALNQ
jgi:glyoxylase-like metal-dependent hydrolase (beta-lactamase superfamily II)